MTLTACHHRRFKGHGVLQTTCVSHKALKKEHCSDDVREGQVSAPRSAGHYHTKQTHLWSTSNQIINLVCNPVFCWVQFDEGDKSDCGNGDRFCGCFGCSGIQRIPHHILWTCDFIQSSLIHSLKSKFHTAVMTFILPVIRLLSVRWRSRENEARHKVTAWLLKVTT